MTTTTTIITAATNRANLSHIDNLTDLHTEIKLVKARIKEREKELGERWKRVPEETFKGAVSLILPIYLSNKVAGTSWTLLRNVSNFLNGSKRKPDLKNEMMGTAKKLGLFTALKAGYNLFKKR